ncbi:MAG: DUF4011 domain-containing protein, partial [Gammaproteobacteria bacterium]|nr:DUF4011 domain-containing protein [Gammaproteobacteria bacterium]
MNTDIHSKLLGSRKELLDLGLRNSLINFRPSRRSLAIVDEKSAVVLDVLYNQHKAMTFLPLAKEQLARLKPEGDDTPPNGEGDSTQATAVDALLMHELEGVAWDQVIAGDAAAEADDAGSQTPARRHTDTRLQTALSDDRLFLSLLRIQNEAESYLEEQGVNVLFLALGFLHWYEDERSEIRRKAPLLLVPVSLKRAGAREAFRLEYTGDDLVSNLSLAAKLKADFRIEYPELALDSEEGDTPTLERFYAQVREAITRQPRWQVADDDICLGFFSFGKFLMFNDLDPAVWPEGAFDGHPVLAPLLSDGFGDDPGQYPEDAHLDRLIAPGDIQCVKDADSSQTLALLESRGGRSLVIQGPPGTGKSQTITNIIADCLGQGKRVLFVAEKMAALEVVKRRLDDVHLGDAVLELHSHKSNRLAVVQELGRTLQQGKPLAP